MGATGGGGVIHCRTVMPIRIRLIYGSTTGHTEYVVSAVSERLSAAGATVTMQRVELAQADDLRQADIILLACGTWNTGGIEGQLNPHMHAFLRERAQHVELNSLPCLAIGLGDRRYRYTANAAPLLEKFLTEHGGVLLLPALKVVDEPYDRLDEVLQPWLEQLLQKLRTFSIA